MKSLCYILLLACLSVFNTAIHANESLASLQQQADTKQLWQKREWLNLLHYKVSADNHYQSQVDDAKFFLSANGATDPAEELKATLAAFYQLDTTNNTQAQCRFPARLNWLMQHLHIDRASLPIANCPEYDEWRSLVRAGHITLVFPAYHLNSPSSMFGHTLLRIDPADPAVRKDWSSWLSYAVNFGADVKADDNSMFYAFKGLSGGYPGLFITTPYFNKIREYNRDENRDIWEYELNLDEAESQRLARHLWELKEINFDYYFFDENCSYRLLELLEVARPSVELTDEFVLTSIPVDTVRAVQAAGMVKLIHYRPSLVTELRYKLERIPAQQLDLVEQLNNNISTLQNPAFTTLSKTLQAQLVDAAYELHRYHFRDTASDAQALNRNYQLLAAVNQHANDLPATATIPTPVSPDQSHLSKRGLLRAGRWNQQDYVDVGLKMSFHDLEDRLAGFLQGAEINIASIELRAIDSSLQLQNLTAVDIFSLTPRSQFFDPLSWRVNFGLERQFTAGKNQLVTQVNGGAGVSYPLWRDSQIYALASARLEYNKQFERSVDAAIGVHTGLLAHFSGNTMHIEFSGEEFTNNVYRIRASYNHNFVLARNHSLRIRAQRNWQNDIRFNDVNLNYQYYF